MGCLLRLRIKMGCIEPAASGVAQTTDTQIRPATATAANAGAGEAAGAQLKPAAATAVIAGAGEAAGAQLTPTAATASNTGAEKGAAAACAHIRPAAPTAANAGAGEADAGAAAAGTQIRPAAGGEAAGVRRDRTIKSYEQELGRAQMWARIIGLLHSLSRFLAVSNLTWATVVLLGAFVPFLDRRDFSFVASLLVLEAVRLASAVFFSRLLTRALSRLSQNPRVIHHAYDGQYIRARRVRLAWHILQLVFISPTSILSAMALCGPCSYPNSGSTHNLQTSLRIFYGVMGVNSLLGLAQLLSSGVAPVLLSNTSEQSIVRYFDKVVENAISGGVVQADEFEFFSFAYNMLAGEFRRNVQPEAVAKNHKGLIRYLYANRIGADFLIIFLDAEDAYVRLAAANMVGFWAETTWGVGWEDGELALSEEVVSKLAEKVGTAGQVGWAATTSVGALARRPGGAHLIQKAQTAGGQPLADRLVGLIGTGSRALSIIRALVTFYEEISVNEQQPPAAFKETPEPKLRRLAGEARLRRLRVQAAYLLRIMGCELEAHVILSIDPKADDYWFKSEVSMLHSCFETMFTLPRLTSTPTTPASETTPISDLLLGPYGSGKTSLELASLQLALGVP